MGKHRTYYQEVPASKYHSEKVMIDGEIFDSRKEARRWSQLLLIQKAGEIYDLRRQVKFELIPAQFEKAFTRNGLPKRGKCLERACNYYADFTYRDAKTGEFVVEDAKGIKTDVYKVKRKLMLYVHGLQIREV